MDCRLPQNKRTFDMLPMIVSLSVEAKGGLAWNGTPIDRQTLSAYFADASGVDPQPIIEIAVRDPNTPYAVVDPVLQAFREHGLHRLWIESHRFLRVPPRGLPFPAAIMCAVQYEPGGFAAPRADLSLSRAGEMSWNGQTVGGGEIHRLLWEYAKAEPHPSVRLVIEPQTPFLLVSDLMLELQESGLEGMRLQTAP